MFFANNFWSFLWISIGEFSLVFRLQRSEAWDEKALESLKTAENSRAPMKPSPARKNGHKKFDLKFSQKSQTICNQANGSR